MKSKELEHAIALAHEAFVLGHKLNMVEDLAGFACQSCFSSAESILRSAFGQDLGHAIYEYCMMSGEHGVAEIERAAEIEREAEEYNTVYIQRRMGRRMETVAQVPAGKARAQLRKWQMGELSAVFYLSNNPCKDWAKK